MLARPPPRPRAWWPARAHDVRPPGTHSPETPHYHNNLQVVLVGLEVLLAMRGRRVHKACARLGRHVLTRQHRHSVPAHGLVPAGDINASSRVASSHERVSVSAVCVWRQLASQRFATSAHVGPPHSEPERMNYGAPHEVLAGHLRHHCR